MCISFFFNLIPVSLFESEATYNILSANNIDADNLTKQMVFSFKDPSNLCLQPGLVSYILHVLLFDAIDDLYHGHNKNAKLIISGRALSHTHVTCLL